MVPPVVPTTAATVLVAVTAAIGASTEMPSPTLPPIVTAGPPGRSWLDTRDLI